MNVVKLSLPAETKEAEMSEEEGKSEKTKSDIL